MGTLDNLDDTKIYLGQDSRTGKSVFKTGMTELDYWLSVRVADESAPATVEANPAPFRSGRSHST
ncbi:hypothetical protein ACFU99_14270 [Streptomyces sp. NPDC057654]|uniref:hypothetical protein n=1 Tax=Streptomyces sp. NPDC057654 TaxID=3346196 RepID=UPI0036818844